MDPCTSTTQTRPIYPVLFANTHNQIAPARTYFPINGHTAPPPGPPPWLFDKEVQLDKGSGLLKLKEKIERLLPKKPKFNYLDFFQKVKEQEKEFGPPFSLPPLTLLIPENSRKFVFRDVLKLRDIEIIELPEDSKFRKLLACIPLIGIIPTVLNERSLQRKIDFSKNAKIVSDIIKIKNHYKIASVIRETLTIALLVSGIALKILTGSFVLAGFGGSIIATMMIFSYIFKINHNKHLIQILEKNGYPDSKIQVK